MDEGFISETKPKLRKVHSDEGNSDIECYDRSEVKPVPLDVDKKFTAGKKSTLALLPNRSEDCLVVVKRQPADLVGLRELFFM